MHSTTDPLRAIIYIPPSVDVTRWEKACYKHCARRGYTVLGLTIDQDGSKWADVQRMLGSDQTDVIVVFDLHALPEDRLPRIEEVGVESTGDHARHRRPRLFRRSGS